MRNNNRATRAVKYQRQETNVRFDAASFPGSFISSSRINDPENELELPRVTILQYLFYPLRFPLRIQIVGMRVTVQGSISVEQPNPFSRKETRVLFSQKSTCFGGFLPSLKFAVLFAASLKF